MTRLAEKEVRRVPRPRIREEPSPEVSVLIPVSDRPGSLIDLYQEYASVLRGLGQPFEVLFIAEPWHRPLLAPLQEARADGEPVRAFSVGQGVGEGALVRIGTAASRGKILVTLPPYPRVQPEVVAKLVERIREGVDLAVARRWPRRDSWINRLQQRVFHRLVQRLTRDRVRDIGCGVRAMRKDLLEEIPLYGDFYRFLPVLALHEGFRVDEIDSPQHPADRNTRLHAPGVYVRRVLDILGLFFLLRFTEKPLRFFGLVGSALSVSGGLILLILAVQRLGGQGIAHRPLLLLGVLLLVLGIQAIALGMIGEIIVHLHAPRRRPYRLARRRPTSQRSESGPKEGQESTEETEAVEESVGRVEEVLPTGFEREPPG